MAELCHSVTFPDFSKTKEKIKPHKNTVQRIIVLFLIKDKNKTVNKACIDTHIFFPSERTGF